MLIQQLVHVVENLYQVVFGYSSVGDSLVENAVVKSIPTLADQLVPVLVPKLYNALMPVLAPKLAKVVLPIFETSRSTSTSDPPKTKAEHTEFNWPKMTNCSKGSFIVRPGYKIRK